MRRALLLLAPIAALAGALLPSRAGAQVPVSPPGITGAWMGLGFLAGTAGLGLQLDASRYSRARLLSLRGAVHAGGFMATRESDDVTVFELSALAGRGAPCCGSNWGGWALGGGIVNVERGTGSTATNRTTIGAAAEAFVLTSRFPNLQLSAFANLNPEKSLAGVSLALAIGRMPFHAVPAPRPRFPGAPPGFAAR